MKSWPIRRLSRRDGVVDVQAAQEVHGSEKGSWVGGQGVGTYDHVFMTAIGDDLGLGDVSWVFRAADGEGKACHYGGREGVKSEESWDMGGREAEVLMLLRN